MDATPPPTDVALGFVLQFHADPAKQRVATALSAPQYLEFAENAGKRWAGQVHGALCMPLLLGSWVPVLAGPTSHGCRY